MLEIINYTKRAFNKKRLDQAVELFLKAYRKPDYLVTLVLCGDTKMKTFNARYRGRAVTTDILSFRSEEYMGNILGEIIINLADAERSHKYQDLLRELKLETVAKKYQVNYIFYFLLTHGLLHLIGYNDDSEGERKKMISLGKSFMNKLAKYAIIKL